MISGQGTEQLFSMEIFRPPRVQGKGHVKYWWITRFLLTVAPYGFYCINQFYQDYIFKNISSENLNVAQKVCRSCEMCLKRAIFWYFDSVPEVSSCCVIQCTIVSKIHRLCGLVYASGDSWKVDVQMAIVRVWRIPRWTFLCCPQSTSTRSICGHISDYYTKRFRKSVSPWPKDRISARVKNTCCLFKGAGGIYWWMPGFWE